MDLNLKGKSALITGGSKGIGRAVADVLAAEGCDLHLAARDGAALDTAAGELAEKFGVTVEAHATDLSQRAAVEDLAAKCAGVDILVNNAGAAPGGVIETLTEDDWAESLQLKFMGYVRCTKAALPHMQRKGHGRIVNLIGNDGIKHSYWEIAPGAANAAGQNFTMSLAGRYGRDGISFVAVNPGPVRTERWDGLVKAMARDMDLSYDDADQLAPRSIPLGRIAEVEEVANLVTYLASDLAHFVNGTMIEIDGGQQKPLMDASRDR